MTNAKARQTTLGGKYGAMLSYIMERNRQATSKIPHSPHCTARKTLRKQMLRILGRFFGFLAGLRSGSYCDLGPLDQVQVFQAALRVRSQFVSILLKGLPVIFGRRPTNNKWLVLRC